MCDDGYMVSLKPKIRGVHFICLHIRLWYALWVSQSERVAEVWQSVAGRLVVVKIVCPEVHTIHWFRT